VADGLIRTPALRDEDGEEVTPNRLVLEGVERCADDLRWLRYRFGQQREPE
jgi:hypothetical protein